MKRADGMKALVNYWELQGVPIEEAHPSLTKSTTFNYPTGLTVISFSNPEKYKVLVESATENAHVISTVVWHGPKSPDDFVKMRQRDSIEMVYVVKGVLNIIIEDKKCSFSAGDTYLLNRNTRSFPLFSEGMEEISLFFAEDFLSKVLTAPMPESCKRLVDFLVSNTSKSYHKSIDYIEFRKQPSTSTDRPGECLHAIKQEMIEKKPGFRHFIHGHMCKLLACLGSSDDQYAIYHNLGLQKGHLADDMKFFMDTHKRRISRKELSEHFNYSEDYLAKLFKSQTGQSIMDYNQWIYLEEAKRLLTDSELSIGDIAKKIGFTNRSQFYKVFEDNFFLTPNAYRNENTQKR